MALTKDNTYTNGDSRLFYLSDDVDNSSIGQLCWSLIFQLQEDDKKEAKEKDFKREPIKLYINSYGGSVYDMWALIDIIVNSKTPIYTYSTSYANSCGFLIFIAGTKRFITKHTRMCVHQISGFTQGTYQDIKEHVEVVDRMWRDVEDYICTQTKITRARLQEVRERKLDWYIYSDESIDLGVATDFIDNF